MLLEDSQVRFPSGTASPSLRARDSRGAELAWPRPSQSLLPLCHSQWLRHAYGIQGRPKGLYLGDFLVCFDFLLKAFSFSRIAKLAEWKAGRSSVHFVTPSKSLPEDEAKAREAGPTNRGGQRLRVCGHLEPAVPEGQVHLRLFSSVSQ